MTDEAVLFSEMTPDPSWEGEFNDWYDEEHIPLRMNVAGFTGAQRYRDTGGPGYLAVYNMSSADVLASDAYGAVKNNPPEQTARMLNSVTGFTRYIGTLISDQPNPKATIDPLEARYLYGVFFNVPDDGLKEFDEWYTKDHVPLLLGCEDWLGVKRYALSDAHPVPFTRLAIHYLASQDALLSDARKAARATPWRDRIAENDWFKGSYKVFEKLGFRFTPAA